MFTYFVKKLPKKLFCDKKPRVTPGKTEVNFRKLPFCQPPADPIIKEGISLVRWSMGLFFALLEPIHGGSLEYDAAGVGSLRKTTALVGEYQATVWLCNVINSSETEARLTHSSEIFYSFRTTNAAPRDCFIPRSLQYLSRITMVDAVGKSVEFAPGFRSVGERFFEIKPEVSFHLSQRGVTRLQSGSVTIDTTAWKVGSYDKLYAPRKLGKITEMFNLTKSGLYQLEVQLQIYERGAKGNCHLVRFAPVEFIIEHRASND